MSSSHPLKAYRQREGVTLQGIAERFGLNASTVLRWEGGRIPAERVLEVERVTGVSRHELRPDLYPDPTGFLPPRSDTPAPVESV